MNRRWSFPGRGIVRSMTHAICMASMILVATGAAQAGCLRSPFRRKGTSTIALPHGQRRGRFGRNHQRRLAGDRNGTFPGGPKDEAPCPAYHRQGRAGASAILARMRSVTVEAWADGSGPSRPKPLYSVTPGLAWRRTRWRMPSGSFRVVPRKWSGGPSTSWGTGRHLFDTYVPPVNFSTSREFFISR